MHHKIALPRGWKRRVRASVLHILTLRQYFGLPTSLYHARALRCLTT